MKSKNQLSKNSNPIRKKLTLEETMQIPLEIYSNGDLNISSARDTKKLVVKSDLIWACPLDRIYSRILGYDNLRFPVYERAGKKGMLLGLYTLTTCEPYTMLQAEKDINNGKHFEHKNTFISLKSRFYRTFKDDEGDLIPADCFPLNYVDIPTGITGYILCPAYQRNPNVDVLVIMGVDCESGYTNSDIPWDYLISE